MVEADAGEGDVGVGGVEEEEGEGEGEEGEGDGEERGGGEEGGAAVAAAAAGAAGIGWEEDVGGRGFLLDGDAVARVLRRRKKGIGLLGRFILSSSHRREAHLYWMILAFAIGPLISFGCWT